MRLRIAILQLNSRLLNVFTKSKPAKTAAETALELVSHIPPNPNNTPQLIVMSEFALSTYNFPSKAALLPNCEEAGRGPNFAFAKELSVKQKSYTLLGYPEKARDKLYNSAILVSPKGELVFNYRKTHLYYTDEEIGVSESDLGFQSFSLDLTDRVVKASIGICMDLNPYKFTAPFESWEFGNHCKDNDVDLVLCPMAWLKMESPSVTGHKGDWSKELAEIPTVINNAEGRKPATEPELETIRYWYQRLVPLFGLKDKIITVIVANRSGMEGDVLYCGSSCILQLNTATRSVDVKGCLGWKDEGLLYRELEV